MNTFELIIKARDVASACSPAIARLLEGMADALERLPLADALAYESARSDIECHGEMVKWGGRTGGGKWYLVTGLRNNHGEQDAVNRAVAYLESRCLIERDSDGLVRVLPERDAAIASEITELENLLATIPEGRVIERMSLESRLESVRADLAAALRGEK